MCILCELAAASNSTGSTNQSKVSLSLTDGAQKLLQFNASWSNGSGQPTEVTYGFRASAPAYNNQVHNQQSTFSKVALQEMEAIRLAFKGWSDVANLKFIEVNPGGYTDNAVMLFGNYVSTTDGANGFATPPYNKISSFSSQEGDVWLNDSKGKFQNVQLGEYDFKTIAHEIGHALGISHPGNYNGGPDVKITYESNAEFREDTRQYSIMSYFDASTLGANHGSEYSLTPLILDIIAIQKLYGKNDQASSSDSIYGYNSNRGALYSFSSTDSNIFSIWDTGGMDTLDASCFGTSQNISLVEGTFSDIGAYTQNISIAPGAVIESARGGGGNDVILGNAANNRLYGNSGSDAVTGGRGDDIIDGGVSAWSEGTPYKISNLSNVFYNPDNKHLYAFVENTNVATTWQQANSTASTFTIFGIKGHLATLTSSQEDLFVRTTFNQIIGDVNGSNVDDRSAYIGLQSLTPQKPDGSRDWQWVTGEKFEYSNWNNHYEKRSSADAAVIFSEDYFETRGWWGATDDTFNNWQTGRGKPYSIIEFDFLSAPKKTDDDIDVAKYSSKRSDYLISRTGAEVSVSDKIIGRDGNDKLTNIERIDFTDGDLIFDVTSANAAAAYRLYGGAFARTPDEGGFRFWASTLDKNVSLRDVATQFISSGEFIGRYGSSLSNAAFVDALYQNVLSRGGDAGGIAYWNKMLNDKLQDRSDVLVQFTQLPEFVGISAANITNGYWVV